MRTVMVAVFVSFSALLQAQDARVVTLDGYRTRVRIAGLEHAGSRQPSVVLESGLGGRLEGWDRVFERVAAFAPVLAYDRAGVGESESDQQPPTPRHIAARLHRLLGQVGLKGPYVLVGHSWGGPLIRMFAAAHPADVAGLVYVDPTDMRTEAEDRAYYVARGHRLEDVPALRKQRRERFRAYGAEMSVALDIEDSHFAEFHALPPLPDVPVSVLMAARFDPVPWAGQPCRPQDCHDAWVRLRTGWLARLARQSSVGTFTLTTNSGHDVPHEDPDLVVWAIERVLRHRPPSRPE
jgi:pimeloyl-ACP methyl ester carboxylesterase